MQMTVLICNSVGLCCLSSNFWFHSFFFMFSRIDDIQDNSILRRGIPVAHSIYGVASTINAANYAMIVALEKCLELGHPSVRFF